MKRMHGVALGALLTLTQACASARGGNIMETYCPAPHGAEQIYETPQQVRDEVIRQVNLRKDSLFIAQQEATGRTIATEPEVRFSTSRTGRTASYDAETGTALYHTNAPSSNICALVNLYNRIDRLGHEGITSISQDIVHENWHHDFFLRAEALGADFWTAPRNELTREELEVRAIIVEGYAKYMTAQSFGVRHSEDVRMLSSFIETRNMEVDLYNAGYFTLFQIMDADMDIATEFILTYDYSGMKPEDLWVFRWEAIKHVENAKALKERSPGPY